jgi:TRAP-type C4-dicarboxylate transport system substrate-binding protein
MTNKNTILTAAALAAAVALSPLGVSAATIMKIGFATINDGQHKSAKWIAKEVMKRTNGSIDVKVYPAAQLGKIPRMIEGVLLGTIEGFISPPGFFKGLNPAFAAPDAPGLFNSFAHQTKTMNHPTVRSKFLNLGTPKGVTGLYIAAAGASALAMREPVRKLTDVKGKKIRVLASPIEVAIMRSLGAAGTPMAYSEVLPAIQRRVLDGASSAITVMGPSKFYTAAKYITPTNFTYIPTALWTNAKWLAKLSDKERAIMIQVGKEVAPVANKWSEDDTKTWERKWGEQGGTVVRLNEAERKAALDKLRPMGHNIFMKDPRIAPMYSLIKAAAKETM